MLCSFNSMETSCFELTQVFSFVFCFMSCTSFSLVSNRRKSRVQLFVTQLSKHSFSLSPSFSFLSFLCLPFFDWNVGFCKFRICCKRNRTCKSDTTLFTLLNVYFVYASVATTKSSIHIGLFVERERGRDAS